MSLDDPTVGHAPTQACPGKSITPAMNQQVSPPPVRGKSRTPADPASETRQNMLTREVIDVFD
jgi:hypothetical protein